MEKKKIREFPPNSIDSSILEGDVVEVSKTLKNLLPNFKKQLKESITNWKEYNSNYPVNPNWDLINQIKINNTYDRYGEGGMEFEFYRDETDKEVVEREKMLKVRAEATKKAKITKQQAQEKRERTLYENLKMKFENEQCNP